MKKISISWNDELIERFFGDDVTIHDIFTRKEYAKLTMIDHSLSINNETVNWNTQLSDGDCIVVKEVKNEESRA